MSEINKKMPVLFVGHGSPMNAIEDNEYTENWAKIKELIPKPTAILAISAHWYTEGTRITDADNPKMVYDMYGFPEELYEVEYNTKGAPELARLTKNLIQKEVIIDNSWGYDHGTWSILHKMYPAADVPVYQLSVDRNVDARTHFQIGKDLSTLRDNGVLIFASGNVVHNLRKLDWNMSGGYPWAEEFDLYIKDKIVNKRYEDVLQYEKAGQSAQLSIPTPEHFYPLLYALGASDESDKVKVFNNSSMLGALSMTSYLFY